MYTLFHFRQFFGHKSFSLNEIDLWYQGEKLITLLSK